jgi:hypothetical protein
MPGLVPGTHALLAAPKKNVGGRDTPGTRCPGAAMTRGEAERAIPPEGEMALGLRGICVEKMQLYEANAGRIGERAIPPPRYAELAVPIVADSLDAPAFPVKAGQVGYQRHQIDDRLGSEPRHRGGADMMDPH